jgi:hypothetical protein
MNKFNFLKIALVLVVSTAALAKETPKASSKRSPATTELAHAYCGTLKDYGDSYQILDGMFNAYLAQDDSAPSDPNGVVKAIISQKLVGTCSCIIGVAESFDRGGQTAYQFRQVTGLKSCKDIIK